MSKKLPKKFFVPSETFADWKVQYSPETRIFESYWTCIGKLGNTVGVLCYLDVTRSLIKKKENAKAKKEENAKEKSKAYRELKIEDHNIGKKDDLQDIARKEGSLYDFLLKNYKEHIEGGRISREELSEIAKIVAHASELNYGIIVPSGDRGGGSVLREISEKANEYLNQNKNSGKPDKRIEIRSTIGILESIFDRVF